MKKSNEIFFYNFFSPQLYENVSYWSKKGTKKNCEYFRSPASKSLHPSSSKYFIA